MNFKSRRITALLLLFVAITGVVMTFSENVLCAGELPGTHETGSLSLEHEISQTHDSNGPSAPSPSHSSDDHFCVGDFGCPCHAPLPSTSFLHTFSRSFSSLYHAEPVRHTPEVYLSLFIPPDSETV